MYPEKPTELLYQQQLQAKLKQIQSDFSEFSLPEIEVFESPIENYRQRCEFRVWHEGDDLYHIMFDQETKQKYRVDYFLPASAIINKAMSELMRHLRGNEILRRKLFQVDYLSTLSGELLISLLYHKPLTEDWQAQALELKQTLSKQFNVNIVGRSRKQKIVLERDFVIEQLTVDGKQLTYQQVENSFTQPNAVVCQHMLSWARNALVYQGDLLELYCGNGNFSIAMADKFNRVLATEISKSSVKSAQYNIAANNVKNLDIIRMSAEEFSEAIEGQREFTRLEGIDLNTYQCQTILVDPPRAGLDPQTLEMISKYENIIYISCNPETLKQNLTELTKSHTITKAAVFDQFPYTHHLECGVILTKA